MFGKLIRLITFNYLTLGWWFPPLVPKWVKARRKMEKPEHWDYIIEMRTRAANKKEKQEALKEAKRLLLSCVPWYSPKEINLALKYLSKNRRVYLPCLDADNVRFYVESKHLVKIDRHRWDCCGGDWLYGDCGCVKPDLQDLRFPYKPLTKRSAD